MPLGLSFCQLQKQEVLLSTYINNTAAVYLPQCQDSGSYTPVQCDVRREQCWCVDTEGMEVYGTRQQGRPRRCKSHLPTVLPSTPPPKTVRCPRQRQRTWPVVQGMKVLKEGLTTSPTSTRHVIIIHWTRVGSRSGISMSPCTSPPADLSPCLGL